MKAWASGAAHSGEPLARRTPPIFPCRASGAAHSGEPLTHRAPPIFSCRACGAAHRGEPLAHRSLPSFCKVAESMLSEITGAKVQERCHREGSPQCKFEIAESK